jgi:predicted ester cyclase
VTETNKELVRRWVEEVINQGSLTACDELMATDYIEHAVATFGQSEPGMVNGPRSMRETTGWLHSQFPDVRMTIESLIAEGDTVAVRVLAEGTNTGQLAGMLPPTGKRFSAHQSHWFRVEQGRLAEHWANREDLPTMLQLGVIQPPGRPPG